MDGNPWIITEPACRHKTGCINQIKCGGLGERGRCGTVLLVFGGFLLFLLYTSNFQPLHFALAFQNALLPIAAQRLSRRGCSRPAALRARERGAAEAERGRGRRWLLLLLAGPASPAGSSLAASATSVEMSSSGPAPLHSGAAAKRQRRRFVFVSWTRICHHETDRPFAAKRFYLWL